MQTLQETYTGKGVTWLSFGSPAPGKEGNSPPARWNEIQKERNAPPTATLLDPDGAVGRSYGAKTTPHMFVIDKTGRIAYAGAIDDAPSGGAKGNYVDQALAAPPAGHTVDPASTKPTRRSGEYCGPPPPRSNNRPETRSIDPACPSGSHLTRWCHRGWSGSSVP